LRKVFPQKYCQLKLKGTERVQNERRLTELSTLTGRKQVDKTSQVQTCAHLHEKRKEDSEGRTNNWRVVFLALEI
jgi:hypothetical protein